MIANPALQRLGFAPDDRVVILHADDIGMCHATLPAFADLVDFGLMSSAATMVPCPWFLAAAAYCRDHPDVDMGVHLTLNSEWATYRWKPLSTSDPASGLLDDEGSFHHRQAPVYERATVEAVDAEVRAQVDRALVAGIDVTHIDTHMGTAGHAQFFPGYVRLGLEHRVPCRVLRLDEEGWRRARGMDAESAAAAAQTVRHLEEQGVPLFDHFTGLPLKDPSDRVAVAKARLDALPPGLSLLIFHPAQDTGELRAIAPDWQSRVADYQTFTSPELRDHIRRTGIQIIGYRPLRDLMRSAP
ncbi:MAG: polysaccharide deacetylase family protein [Chloroflexota bacterium]